MAKDKILVVEDEESWSDLVQDILEKKGFAVAVADNADEAMQKVRGQVPALVILDVNLKGISGLKLCEMLRMDPVTTSVPILMLTVLEKEKDKVKGLEMGADDYLVKPFGHEELAARVGALLRRTRPGGDSTYAAPPLSTKDLVIDTERHEVLVKNKKVDLRPKEFDLLLLLMQKKGRVLRKEFLADSVWGRESVVTSETLAQHIKNLRGKLGPCAHYIETVETLGYKFSEE